MTAPGAARQALPGVVAGGPKAWARVLRESLIVVGAAIALGVAMTWPALKHPTRTIPHDLIDEALMGWEIRWAAHAVLHQPGQLFDANAFYPDRLSYAFSDTLFGFWPLGLLGDGPRGAALAINLVYVSAFILPAIGGYALARQLGANIAGSTVAGLVLAYSPWRFAQISHLHVISTGGIVLALAMLARGHGFSLRRGLHLDRARPFWIVAGWLVAAWQMSIGFGIGLVFAYVLAGLCVTSVILWWRHRRPRIRPAVLLANAGGGLVFAAVSLFMARPYLQVLDLHPYARRTFAELTLFSPWPQSFLIGPGESLLWQADPGHLRSWVGLPGEMALLMGFAVYVYAAFGSRVSVWPRRWARGLSWAILATMFLALGTRIPVLEPYALFYLLPGWDGIRTPGRLVVWTTILLAVAAAGAVTAVTELLTAPRSTALAATPGTPAGPLPPWLRRPAVLRLLARPRPWLARSVGVLAAALVLVEGLMVVEHKEVPDPPAALTSAYADQVRPPLMVLPSTNDFDALVMLWSTDGFPAMANGLSGFTPHIQQQLRDETHTFPDAESIALLRGYGIRTVVVLRSEIVGTPWAGAADRPVDGLGITRSEIGDAVVFSLQ